MALKYPPAPPANGYRPRLCIQTDVPAGAVINNCVPASLVPMIDVWTRGDVRLTHQEIRAGADIGPMTYANAAGAIGRIAGLKLLYSEATATSTERVSWAELIDRLSRGGAASVVGHYRNIATERNESGQLLIRHQPSKVNLPDFHAVAVSNHRPAENRIWLQDPMADDPPGFEGEWITREQLHKFINKTGTAGDALVTAAVTPDPDKFPPEKTDVLNDFLKTMRIVANRRAHIRVGTSPRSEPAFDGTNHARFRVSAPFTQPSSAPLLGWVKGTNITSGTGAVLEASTQWAVLHNSRWGVYFVHESDVTREEPIEAPGATPFEAPGATPFEAPLDFSPGDDE